MAFTEFEKLTTHALQCRMDAMQSERHVAELRRTLHGLVDEAEKRVLALETELGQAKLVLIRMRKAVTDADKPFTASETERPANR